MPALYNRPLSSDLSDALSDSRVISIIADNDGDEVVIWDEIALKLWNGREILLVPERDQDGRPLVRVYLKEQGGGWRPITVSDLLEDDA
jgi:hypothetical protein